MDITYVNQKKVTYIEIEHIYFHINKKKIFFKNANFIYKIRVRK